MTSHFALDPTSGDAIRARHEACHAVVLLAYQLPCHSVDIIEDGHIGGTTSWRTVEEIIQPLPRTERADRWVEYLAVTMAPQAYPVGYDPDLVTSCSQDLRDAEEFADKIIKQKAPPTGYTGPLDREGLYRYALAAAGDLLKCLSHHVDDLAAKLTDPNNNGKLGRSELNRAYGRIYADLHSSS